MGGVKMFRSKFVGVDFGFFRGQQQREQNFSDIGERVAIGPAVQALLQQDCGRQHGRGTPSHLFLPIQGPVCLEQEAGDIPQGADVDLLPAAESTTLVNCSNGQFEPVSARPLVAECLEEQGRLADAIKWCQAELSDPFQFK